MPDKSLGETSNGGLSTVREVENPYKELQHLLINAPPLKKRGHASNEEPPPMERNRSESSNTSMEDVTPPGWHSHKGLQLLSKGKDLLHSSPHCKLKREERNLKKKRERRRSPSSPSLSPSSSSNESSGYYSIDPKRRVHRKSYPAWKRSNKLKKFKKERKKILFLTYNDTFGATDKVLTFIQQFDAAFGDDGLMESSKPTSLLLKYPYQGSRAQCSAQIWHRRPSCSLSVFYPVMASSTICSVPSSMIGMVKSQRHLQSTKVVSPSRMARIHMVRAAQVQSVPHTREVENLSLKGDVEDSAMKVFADDTKGIVCYQTESGEVVCEGMDEGPQFYPPCGANLYMPDTRAAAILPLLGEVMYEI
ncbi:hypothetical protein L7F22_042811 [Adiantum nelumboides]|nr:hypothetical protein [Adiantum nelumboides]